MAGALYLSSGGDDDSGSSVTIGGPADTTLTTTIHRESTPPATAPARTLSIGLPVPDRWSVGSFGESMAHDAADLDALVPSGPRVRIVRSGEESTGGSVVVVQPRSLTLLGAPAIATEVIDTVEGIDLHRIYVLIPGDGRDPITIICEAPIEIWDGGAGGVLRGIVGILPE